MLVRLEIANLRVKEEFRTVISSINGFKVQKTEDKGSCDLLILEVGDDSQKSFKLANKLKASGVAGEVFLTSSIDKPEVLIEALNMGFKRYFTQPIKIKEVRTAILKIEEQKEDVKVTGAPVKMGKIIDVFGGKGGVGTTTVAVNLAISLAKLEGTPSVALIDMNILFGEISLHLNIEPMFDWVEVIKNISRLDSTFLMDVLSEHSSGIQVLSPPSKLPESYTVRPQDLETLLREMQTMFDFVVIDVGQLLNNDNSRAIMEISDKVIIVSVLNLPTIINLKILLDIFRKRGFPREENIEIIVNRFHKDSEISLKELEESVKKKVLCRIPNDYDIFMSSLNQGNPVCAQIKGKRRETEIRNVYGELASTLAGKSVEKKKKGFFARR